MFRTEKTPNNKQLLQKLQEDKFLRERFSQESKPNLVYSSTSIPQTIQHSPVLTNVVPKTITGTPCDETQVISDDVLRDNKTRQLVRENSPEIRELEKRLQVAYTNKLRSVQIAEKNALLARRQAEEAEERRLLANKIAEEEKQLQLKEAESQMKKSEYRKLLEQQVSEQNSQLMLEAYLNFLNEKMLIDEIVRKIIEEDRSKVEMQIKKSQEFRDEINKFMHTQEEHRKKEVEVQEEENRRIATYLSHKTFERQAEHDVLQIKNMQSMQIRDRLLAVLEETQKQMDEERSLQTELACASRAREDSLREQELTEKSSRDRLKFREALEEQLLLKSQMKELEKEEEKMITEQMLQRLAEEHKLEQLSREKRRIKQMEHRRSVEALLRERRVEKERIRQREIESLQKIQKIQEERHKIIEEERHRILKEHAVKLLGFLPKGILQNDIPADHIP